MSKKEKENIYTLKIEALKYILDVIEKHLKYLYQKLQIQHKKQIRKEKEYD